MSLRTDKILSLAIDQSVGSSLIELKQSFSKILNEGIHGIGFSAYEEHQEPGMPITEAQIRRRMSILQPYCSWVRSFSCTDGNELIPVVAREMGIKTLVGAWLGTDEALNEKEIAALIELGNAGMIDIAAVGNEVMYRGDLSEAELINYIQRVKAALPNIPVGYVDAYYQFEDRPRITEICDVILSNCYPFWEGCHIDYALLYMKDMYRRAVKVANGKKVIITETGWPDKGQSFHGAVPSTESAIRYFVNTQKWVREDKIDLFYFSSFDEPWKTGDEGDVGAFWGLWDKDEQLKYK